ncbi:hypothetical protein DLAC_11770 [Tieghemostelium lacteum]|uniref:Transmembrane protein n=1 Tax=Tieghemostelium lacteum TaxID=361077 RepID=A0A151Z9T5_TIELA|nr:hypothetical protein DLAC_11770 [Tieghemostelium lacteum]|eukprot:KYQ90693.1 hypothetical protein DLAC_11770 [Tieghemostelium lacteum]
MKLASILLTILLVNIVSCDFVNQIYYDNIKNECNDQYNSVYSYETDVCSEFTKYQCDYSNNRVIALYYKDKFCSKLQGTQYIPFDECGTGSIISNCSSEPYMPENSYSQFTFTSDCDGKLPISVFSAPLNTCFGVDSFYFYTCNSTDLTENFYTINQSSGSLSGSSTSIGEQCQPQYLMDTSYVHVSKSISCQKDQIITICNN